MDNDQPWQPPRPHSGQPIMVGAPEVPELTIFSPATNQKINKPNFIQRITKSDEKKGIQKQVRIQQQRNPSVPDLSILEPQVQQSSQKNTNIFDRIPVPSVPEVTILDEEPKQNQNSNSERVFDNSYKKMLINSHEQFMRQIRSENTEKTNEVVVNGKKSALFNNVKYQENPLRKYAPKPMKPSVAVNLDNSSILITDELIQPTPVDEDEITFKKVAAMLNQIQQLSLPSSEHEKQIGKVSPTKVLKQLAIKYLTNEEQIQFDIENEFKELERFEEDNVNS